MLPTIERIIYASDLGDNAPAVFAHAVALARQHGARMRFVHAIEPLGSTAQTLVRNILPAEQLEQLKADGLARVRAEIQKRIQAFCESELGESAEGREIMPEIRLVDGMPAEAILAEADDWDASLIVMGTHSRGGLLKALVGSVAQKVITHADRPVLLVPIPDDLR